VSIRFEQNSLIERERRESPEIVTRAFDALHGDEKASKNKGASQFFFQRGTKIEFLQIRVLVYVTLSNSDLSFLNFS